MSITLPTVYGGYTDEPPKVAPRVWLFADYNQAESRVVAWKGPVPKLKQWYQEGVDVHLKVTRLIAKVVQQNRIQLPVNPDTGKMLFYSKSYEECDVQCAKKCLIHFSKGDEEREIAKRGVHAGNYDEGAERFGIRTGLPTEHAVTFKTIYNTLFPEIKTNYHAWIEKQIRTTKTIWTPDPVRFRKVFHGVNSYVALDADILRQAYAAFPQSTIGAMLNRTIRLSCRIFLEDEHEKLRDQWCAWYGKENWDEWRILRDRGLRTPRAILWSGMDIRLNIHDAGGMSIPDDPDLVRWAAETWRGFAETPIQIHPNETMIVPCDFKKGPTWGAEDLKDYKLAK